MDLMLIVLDSGSSPLTSVTPTRAVHSLGLLTLKPEEGNHKLWCIFMKWDCCSLRTSLASKARTEYLIMCSHVP